MHKKTEYLHHRWSRLLSPNKTSSKFVTDAIFPLLTPFSLRFAPAYTKAVSLSENLSARIES